MPSSTDRLEKSIVLPVPRARVWQAITDVHEFNEWFGVDLTAPFVPGAAVSGRLRVPGYEHLLLTAWVETIEPERRFAFRWHPNATDTSIDYSGEPTTLVTFTLEDVDGGTRLTIVESGFDALPESRRIRALTSNSNGWTSQLTRIAEHVSTARTAKTS
ncbi:MAG TPA: SRPBCC family protein [Gemmatimonadaceae bacterium]|jgi:uncharacterized protein YndB with AHSA1/START domain|nr:SRPBCC family protein [Gemmatimonadaceae bacterium]